MVGSNTPLVPGSTDEAVAEPISADAIDAVLNDAPTLSGTTGIAGAALANTQKDESARSGTDTDSRAQNAFVVLRSGKLRIHRRQELGKGGAATVRPARDLALRRDLAIKMLNRPDDPHARARFVEEAQITGQLQHPNIVPIYELALDEDGSTPILAMKRVNGRAMHEILIDPPDDDHAPGCRAMLRAFLKVCDAVAYAHDRGVIHRDLKPHNIMIGEFGEVLVMDWGLARPIRSQEEQMTFALKAVTSDRRLANVEMTTQEGHVVGTLAYMPPEQASGMLSQLDETADVYALGGVLYSILTARPPFSGNAESVHKRVLKGQMIKPSDAAPDLDVPAELEAVVLRAMHRTRRLRYQSVLELKADVEAYLEGRTLAAAEYTTMQLVTKWVRRNPWLVTASAAVLLAVVSLTVAAFLSVNAARAETEARAEQAEADSARVRAEADARENHLRMLAEQARFEELREAVGARVSRQRDAMRRAFFDAQTTDLARFGSQDAFYRHFGHERLAAFAEAFEDAIRAVDAGADVLVTVQDFVSLGHIQDHLGRRVDAMKTLQRALKMAPDNAAALNALGTVHARMGRLPDALDCFNRALELDATDPHALQNRAHAKRDLGDLPGALADATNALSHEPRNAGSLVIRGTIHVARGDRDLALADFNAAIALGSADGYYQRARLYAGQGNSAAALADYDECVLRDPNHAGAWNNRGLLRGRTTGDVEGALGDFRKATQADPSNWQAWANVGQTLTRLDRGAEAVEPLQRAWSLCDDAAARNRLAAMLHQNGGQLPDAADHDDQD